MFSKIRLDLAKAYTAMLVGFLAVLAFIGFAVFVGSVYIQQKEQVELLALEESEEYWYILKYGSAIEKQKDMENSSTTKKIFYKAVNGQGDEVGSHYARQSEIEEHAKQVIKDGDLDNGEVEFYLFFEPNKSMFISYMMTKKVIYDGDKMLGAVYAGRDVQYFVKLIGIVFVFLLIFLGVLSYIAYYLALKMADKAMIPIEAMYQRQKEFTADASHELRTPLSIFMSSIETVEMDAENKLSEFSRGVLHDLKDETRKMKQLIENLLMLARADQPGLVKTECSIFCLNDLVEEEMRQWEVIAKKRGIILNYAATERAQVNANIGQIRQVIRILLDNACKYTFENGNIQVSITNEAKNVVALTVVDNGCGIEEEYKELIFERFFRIDKMRSRKIEGTGLGLSIAKCLVDVNNGQIMLISKVGEGTAFKVTLQKVSKIK